MKLLHTMYSVFPRTESLTKAVVYKFWGLKNIIRMIHNRILQILPNILRSTIDHVNNQHTSPSNNLDTTKHNNKRHMVQISFLVVIGSWGKDAGVGREVVLGTPLLSPMLDNEKSLFKSIFIYVFYTVNICR